jgi:tetratricopeptide (TPR) repeat protein
MESTQPRPELYQSGGTLSAEIETYVEREADSELVEELRRGHYCYVLTPRQMGKSSLIVRTRQRLAAEGFHTVVLDLTILSKGSTEEQWYSGHVDEIANELGLDDYDSWWTAHSSLGPLQRFTRFLSDYVLEKVNSQIVIFVDEIDSTIGRPYSDDYFAGIRALFNERPHNPKLRNLTFALLGVAAPADLIRDVQRTPFNIGKRIELTDFTWQEAAPLVKGLAPEPDLAMKLLERVLFWTGGHPYLSQKTCQVVAEWAKTKWNPSNVPSIVDQMVRDTFLHEDCRKTDFNLQLVADRIASFENGKPTEQARKLLAVYREIVRGARVADEDLDPIKVALKLSGLVVLGTDGLRIRNRIYETVFDETWIRSVLGDAEKEAESGPQYDVFISYSRRDSEFVVGYLLPALRAAGLRVAIDQDLGVGSDLIEGLKRARESSEYFLPVISPEWLNSQGAQEEFALMSNRVGKIVPLLLRPTRLPPFLQRIKHADFTEQSRWEAEMAQLVKALGGHPEPVPAPPTSPVATSSGAPAETPPQLLSQVVQKYGREELIKLISERFRPLLAELPDTASHQEIAARLVEFATRTGIDALLELVEVKNGPDTGKSTAAEPSAPGLGRNHAFVVIPFGIKQGIDFNRVYHDLIRPALETAGFDVFRGDEELRAGDIRPDMFQELLLADLVVAELSTDNPNVWYELGVRHSLRARGVIQVQAAREYMPFDIYVDRALRYHIKDGIPDPEFIEHDRAAIAQFANETLQFWYSRRVNPVYHLLRHLKEPDWKSLRVEEAKELWAAQEQWERRIDVARRLRRAGDILVLADEAPSRALRLEAYQSASRALLSLGAYKLSLEQCERALELDPADLEIRRRKGLLLSRLHRIEECREWIRAVLRDHPDDGETWALLGRVEKDAWINTWRDQSSAGDKRSHAAAHSDLLRRSFDAYASGFLRDPRIYYSGLNAVTLLSLLEHLTGRADPERRLQIIGGVRWAAQSALEKNPQDYWTLATLADLDLLEGTAEVDTAYIRSVSAAENDWFRLDSSRQQLAMLSELGFKPERTQRALQVIEAALEGLVPPKQVEDQPRQVVLFTGHMIDKTDRAQPRFPPHCEPAAAEAIDRKLEEINASAGDLAICSGANGGDLLFAEACLRRGMRLEVRIPFEEQKFLRESVTFAGDVWRDRFYAVKANANTKLFVMPQELGPTPDRVSPYSRNNLWMMYSALAWGDEKLCLICLWDGRSGDGPGGTEQLVRVAEGRSGRVYRLDPSVVCRLS